MATSKKSRRGGTNNGSKAPNITMTTREPSSTSSKWNFPGNDKRINKLENSLENAKTENGRMRVYDGLESLDKSLVSQRKHIDEKTEDIGALNAQLRKVRTLKKNILETNKYKTAAQAADYIKEQVNLDISKYHNSASKAFEKRGQYTIDISDMGKDERNRLATALNQKYSPYTGKQSGTWIFTITKKK